MMKVVIIEDEKRSADRLQNMLGTYDSSIEILGTLASVEEAVNWFKGNISPELVFMDIHLEDDHCFSIFERINLDIPVIFITAYDEYMIKAFKVNSVDYLMKPVHYEELVAAIEKFKKLYIKKEESINLEKLLESVGVKGAEYKERFLITIGSRLKTIETREISYFYSSGKITFLVTDSNQRFPVDYSLDKLGTVLDPKQFFRVNRHTIVKHAAIRNVHVFPKGRIKLELVPDAKEEVLVSIDRVTDFKEWMGR